MIGLSLLGVLIVAKSMVVAGHGIGWSGWAPVALLSQDLVTASVALGLDGLTRRRAAWLVYGVAVVWIALSVPIAAVVGSPLTVPMLRAAGGPLADSIALYVTIPNIARIAVCAAAGVLLPIVLAKRPRVVTMGIPILVTLTLAFVVLAPVARRHVGVAGLDRNAFSALLPAQLPAVSAAADETHQWRSSPFPAAATIDLAGYRGSARGMNIVMVVLESTGAQYLRAYGAAADPMPNLTALAAQSLMWQNAYAAYPESIKGLYATLCARYPAFNEAAEDLVARPCASFVERLRSAGYSTSLFHSGRFEYLGMDAVLGGKGFDLLADAGVIGGNVRSSFGVDEPSTVGRLLDWIDSRRDRPFFAAYLPIAGHHPYATPQPGPFPAEDSLGQYRNALHYADAALGQLLNGLRARRLHERTVVVVFGDHGEAFNQHAGNVGHSFFVHEENVHVPMLIHVPGVTTTMIRVDAVSSLVDAGPTILDLAGVPNGSRGDGLSLLERGAHVAYFFTDYTVGRFGLRDGCWKFILEADTDRAGLFDLCRDPGERVELTASLPDRARVYRDRIGQWMAAALTRNVPAP